MSYKNIAQVNEDLKNVKTNLNKLEELLSNGGNVSFKHLQEETNKLLCDLEVASPKRILKIAKIRQKRRQRRRKTRKLTKEENETQAPPVASVLPRHDTEASKTNANALRKQADTQRFLQTFDLLERLHQSRIRNTTVTSHFANRVSSLRRTWLNELWSSTFSKTKRKSFDTHWEEVLFGGSKPLKHQTIKDFLRIRQNWDSYISKSKSASSIPNGWVMPQASEKWQKYLAQ